MFEAHNDRIAALLAEGGFLGPAGLAEACEQQRLTGTSLAQVVINRGWLSRDGLLRAVAAHLGFVLTGDLPQAVPAGALALIPEEVARRFGVVPWREDDAGVDVAVLDPFRPGLGDDLAFVVGRPVRVHVADPAHVEPLFRRSYPEKEVAESAARVTESSESDADELAALAAQAPVVRFVNGVLAQAVRDRASDLHFEPFEDEFRVRCRIDGALFDLPPPPRALGRAITSRLKVLANLDIAERRLPQDGRLRLNLETRSVDLRVSTLPTQFGESVVLRVLDRSATGLQLEELGLPPPLLGTIADVIRRPNGLVIVTGPTGSGKTTTLYSCLQRLNEIGAKLLTVEDPVEYEIEGVMQVSVNPAAGLTFAAALRSFLRHDPDIVMVGEIRDLETAQIAIQSALTGHLVLTTLHTNDAPGAITRLTDMGIEPFLLGSTLEAVLAQRLARTICPDCRESSTPDVAALGRVGLTTADLPDERVARGRGCGKCHGSGYRGRLGFFELLRMDDGLRELVVRGGSLDRLREASRARGVRTLREDGLRLVREGVTTPEEISRYI